MPNELLLFVLSFIIGIIGFAFGSGFGTLFTPTLILLGFKIKEAIFLVLSSQLCGDVIASLVHHKIGNANFSKNSSDMKLGLIYGLAGVVALIGATFAVIVNEFYLVLYTALLLIFLGTSVAFVKNGSREHLDNHCLSKACMVASIASFNKALTGGNYGPTILVGSMLIGIDIKKAIAITSLSSAIICMLALIPYILSGHYVGWLLTLMACIGAGLSAAISPYFIKKAHSENLRKIVCVLIVVLGIATLLKVVIPTP